MKLVSMFTVLAASAALSAPAHAGLTSTGMSCDGHGTGMTSIAGYLDCSGSWSGNNSNQTLDLAAQLQADWNLTDVTSVDVTGGIGASSGTLNFATQTGVFVLALKAGNAFSLYEFDGSQVAGGISSINFDTLGVGFFSGRRNNVPHFGQGLSHADIYTTPVPEPETYALMAAGLGVLAFVQRRRRAAA